MCILGKVGRPGVSCGVLGCPGVIRLTGLKAMLHYLVERRYSMTASM